MFTNSECNIREGRTSFGAGMIAAMRRFGDEVLAVCRRFRQRSRLRRDLLHMEERQFRDIGLTRAELEAEAAKPFWRR